MLSSCTLVSCTSSQKGLSHNSQPVLKELGTKAKPGGVQPPKSCPPKKKNLHSPGEPPGGTGTALATAAQGFSFTYETRQTWGHTQIKSPLTERVTTGITSDRARGCGGDRETLALVSTELLLLGTGQDRRAGWPCRDRGALGRSGVSLQGQGCPGKVRGDPTRTGVSREGQGCPCKDRGI